MTNPINGALTMSSTTVSTSATAIPSSNASGRRTMVLRNNGSVTVYLGNSSVATTTGFPLDAGATLSLDIGDDVVLYGLTSSSTADIRALEGA